MSARSMAGPAAHLLDQTLGGMLDEVSAGLPDQEAIVFGGRRITYAELQREAKRFARALLALGVRKGDPVAFWLPNRPAWLFAQYGCALVGAVVVALNTRYRSHELGYVLAQSDARVLVLADRLGSVDFLETLHAVFPGLREASHVGLHLEGFPFLERIVVDADEVPAGCVRLTDALAEGDQQHWGNALEEARARVTAADPVTILYTSGTTAFPKGAVITHRNCLPHGWYCGEVMRLTAADRVLHGVPLSGTWGGLSIPLSTFTHGATLVLMEAFDAGEALRLMAEERITVWHAVEAMVLAVLEHPDLQRRDRSSLRTGMVGGGIPGVFESAVERIGIRQAFQPWGMTEVNAMALCHDLDEPVEARALPGGWPAPGLEARVVDPDTGEDRPTSQEGELWLRGRLVMAGYYKNPEETARVLRPDGWFRTGDLAVMEPDGRIIFKSRLKEVLRISHFMVAPAEIEAFVMTHPKVREAVVVGVPDPRTTEAPVAFVIPRSGVDLTEDEVIAHCRGHIAPYKIPRHVRIVGDVPRTPGPHGDKVQRARLREMFLAETGSTGPEGAAR